MTHASIGGARSRAEFAEIARHVAGGESSYARLRAEEIDATIAAAAGAAQALAQRCCAERAAER